MDPETLNFSKGGGLIPAIVQDAASGSVLMQAYMNRDALNRTLSTGKVTFFSRSKQKLWTKGETSGNYLLLGEILADCDRDCLLIRARPQGPACHTGQNSCFGVQAEDDRPSLLFLHTLENLLRDRKNADPGSSYTARLLAEGPKKIAKKLGEEAVEVVLEAEQGSRERLIEEAADLVYHLSVLLLSRELSWEDVAAELEKRHSG